MFDYFVASAKLLLLFLIIFLCSIFSPIKVLFLFLSAVVAGNVTAVDVAVIAAGMAAVGSDAICGTAVAAFVDVAAVAIAVVAASVAAVGPDAICGTAAAWFHVVDYAC